MRDRIRQLAERRAQGQHPGLLLERFLAVHDKDGEDKRQLTEAARAASRDGSLLAVYRLAFERWNKAVPAVHAALDVATPPHTRLIVGLGSKGVIEAGLRLHHTYGVPVLPGSALKGLASHYCADVWGADDPRCKRGGEFHDLLFGTTTDGGVVGFEDAWLHPDSLAAPRQGVLKDVMTPHHQQWQTEPGRAPTDFDSPVPVPFLSVAGKFRVAVCWQGPEHPQAERWTKRALLILEEALKEWGIGGKTSSGYGRLLRPESKPSVQHRPPAGPAKKRDSNTPARVTIVRAREKGFDVQEEGRAQGVLTLGSPPPGVNTEPGSVVDVLVHNDEARKPQYKWPPPARR